MNDRIIRTMIVEDNREGSYLLEKYLASEQGIEVVASVRSVDEATLAYLRHRPDLVFLDVELEGRTGFEFLDNIRGITPAAMVIFTTAFSHYAVEAIRHSAFDYLLKPIDPEELSASISRYKAMKEPEEFDGKLNRLKTSLRLASPLKLSKKHGFVVVRPAEIIYCTADWNYTEVYLTDNTRHTITVNIGRLVGMLPEADFIRANRSLILNINYLHQVDKDNQTCVLKNGNKEVTLPLSTSRIRKLERLLNDRSLQ